MKGWRAWGLTLLAILGMIGCSDSSGDGKGLKFTEEMVSGTALYQRYVDEEEEEKTSRSLLAETKILRDEGGEESPDVFYIRFEFLPDHNMTGQFSRDDVYLAPGLTWHVENGKLRLKSDDIALDYFLTLVEKDDTKWVVTDGNTTVTWYLQQKFTPETLTDKAFITEDNSYLYRFDSQQQVTIPQAGQNGSDIRCSYEIDEKGELLIRQCRDGNDTTSQTHKIYRMPLEIFEEELSGNPSGNYLAVWNDTNETDTSEYFGDAEDLWMEFIP